MLLINFFNLERVYVQIHFQTRINGTVSVITVISVDPSFKDNNSPFKTVHLIPLFYHNLIS